MTREVKRYDSYGYDGMSGIMKEHAEGDWVSAEDYAALEQECERLRDDLEKAHRATNSECQDWAREYERRKAVQAERDAALLQVEAMRGDAERYRWLREQEAERGLSVVNISGWERAATCWATTYPDPESLDAAIDAALQAKP